MIPATIAAVGILTWPDGRPLARLRAFTTTDRRLTYPAWPPSLALTLLAAATVGLVTFKIGGAIAAVVIAATVRHQLTTSQTRKDTLAAIEGLAEALRSFAETLRAGAHPVAAAESAAAEAHPIAAGVLTGIAAAARLGGDVEQTLAANTTSLPAIATHLHELGLAIRLAHRHGLPLADVIAAAGRDLELRARHAKDVQARMAGPRTTAAVLSALPVIGLALGQAVGAAPLYVLSHSTVGQAMLVLGALLVSAGLAWTARLTGQAALR